MNGIHYKNNTYKNGEYRPDHSLQMAKEKAKSIVPSLNQLEYRDALYEFCVQKGLIHKGFRLGLTRQNIHSNIRALITILKKNGLEDEFFAREVKQPADMRGEEDGK